MPDAPTLLARHPIDVVVIGASAGGLEAIRRLLQALPTPNGMAFIFIQHLDPDHDSSLAELLAPHTGLVVLEAEDGMPLLADHLYVIRPGTSLSLARGALRVSLPREKHGLRLPLDFMLASLAREQGERAMAIVLSGGGFDGTKGAQAIRAGGGLVLVQDPAEADFTGMPESVTAAGAASAVLPLAEMPAALQAHSRGHAAANNDYLPRIITLLKQHSGSDFELYKPGTLRRRVERRMGISGLRDLGAYTAALETDPQELAMLGKDMLIHVTAFFRDPAVFTKLEADILPGLVASHRAHLPIRVWVAGCSTGEETWSLAMLFQEAITTSGKPIRLQVFASDLDAEAVATARRGVYPATIASEVSAERLARFFTEEDGNWRVSQELRSCIVFSVQDVLADAGLAARRYDAVFVYSSAMAPYVTAAPGWGDVQHSVLDLVDVDSEKWLAYAAEAPVPQRWIWAREARTLLAYERRAAAAFARTILVSEPERDRFVQLAPEAAARTGWVDNGVDLTRFDPALEFRNPYTAGRPALVFTGTMDYRPNIQAVLWFAAEVMPLLRATDWQGRGAPEFHIVGARPSEAVRALAAMPDIRVTGRVADTRPYIAHAAVAVAPLLIARGIQNKVLEAMALAAPVVASSAAFEGVRAMPGRDLLVADGASATAQAINGLLQGTHAGLGRAGRVAMEQGHDWGVTLRRLDPLLEGAT